MLDTKKGQLTLDTPVQFLKGVGPRRAEVLSRLGVHTVEDLLHYYPRTYEFRPPLSLIGQLRKDELVTIAGQIQSMRYVARSRPPRLDLVLEDASGRCHLVWFHGKYLRDKLLPGDFLAAWGKVSLYKEAWQLVNPRWTKIRGIEDLDDGEKAGIAVYPSCSDIGSGDISRIIRTSLDRMLALVPEWYDEQFLEQRKLLVRSAALQHIHRPASPEHIAQARRRLIYDEFFLMELGIALRRRRIRNLRAAYAVVVDDNIDKRIRRLFPFILTDDQDRVIREICADMARSRPMNRLLQGDVGSGKTVVALYAALLAVARHYQAAIMAPTEILAEQHFDRIDRFLQHSRVRRVLLKGGLTGRQRKEMLEEIRSGKVDLVVGTQALLQQDVAFRHLALVVIDEQHKFGVRQRELIRSKDKAPHCLVMTATPIPRTLAMTVFGDLDVSLIKHLPPGRKRILTKWYHPDKLAPAYEFIRARIKRGEQAFFVYPRVEQADDEECNGIASFNSLKSAVEEYERLRQEIFPEFNLGLLHGQMDKQKKQQVMEAFRRGRIHILVATVVIEVGVDVPNATIMVIEHAERFGLAQLHQLRGRIGRGDKESCCFLFSRAATEQAQARLEIMTRTNNGFRIAEEDLRIRGPGEFFGTEQHGLPELKLADLLGDQDLLRMARRDAFALVDKDPQLGFSKHRLLRSELKKRFGKNLTLIDVG